MHINEQPLATMTSSTGKPRPFGRGWPLRHLSLLMLTFQNTALILLLHYSRIMPPVNGQRYFPSTAVLLNELIKLTVSLTLSLYEISVAKPSLPATTLFSQLAAGVFSSDLWKLAIPALLYTLQNSLQYVAVSNLDPSTYHIASQLKILSTAAFSVFLLRKKLSPRRWVALIILTIGVSLVCFPRGGGPITIAELRGEPSSGYAWPKNMEELKNIGSRTVFNLVKRSATYQGIKEDDALHNPRLLPVVGLVATLISAVCSGLAGVYFEKLLKDPLGSAGVRHTSSSLWIRNAQLSLFSIIPAFFIGVVFIEGESISKHGFFAGYNGVVWLVVIMQALGGLLVAMVINYANNVAKNFATSYSVTISFLGSVWFFGLKISFFYLLGTAAVLWATWLYNQEEVRRPPQIIVHDNGMPAEKGFLKDVESMNGQRSRDRYGDGLSSSRPVTPSGRRTPSGYFSPDLRSP